MITNTMSQFLGLCHQKKFAAKEILHRPGEEIDTLSYIIDGSVVVYVTEEGSEIILAYINAGEFIGEMGVFDETKTIRESTIKVRKSCTLAQISYQRLRESLSSELRHNATDMLYMFGKQLTKRLSNTSRRIKDMAFLDIEGRIAQTLLDLTSEPDSMSHPEGTLIKITRQELSHLVACSREMAGQALKSLEKKGLVMAHGKSIVIIGEYK